MRPALCMALMLVPLAAQGYALGITGYSGQYAGFVCDNCHSGGPTPQVTLVGPTILNAGTVGDYQLIIDGGAGVVCGFDVSLDRPGLLVPVGQGEWAFAGEISHAFPRPFSDAGTCVFQFQIVAPRNDGPMTLYGDGNSANGDNTDGGDQASIATLSIQVVGTYDAGAAPPVIPAAAPNGEPAVLGTQAAGCAAAPAGAGVFWLVVGAAFFLLRARATEVIVAPGSELDGLVDLRDNNSRMGELIDLHLVTDARRYFHKLLDARGLAYFLRKDGQRPFQIESAKVEMVVRTAARARPPHMPRPPVHAVDHVRKEIRRELIRRVVEAMLQTGL